MATGDHLSWKVPPDKDKNRLEYKRKRVPKIDTWGQGRSRACPSMRAVLSWSPTLHKPDTRMYTCNLSTREEVAEESVLLRLHVQLEARQATGDSKGTGRGP